MAISTTKKRRAAGLCVGCGNQPRPGKTLCATCNKKNTLKFNRWRQRNRDKQRVIARRHRQRLKERAMIALGGRACACCGEATIEFLVVDHVNGDGAKHLREI